MIVGIAVRNRDQSGPRNILGVIFVGEDVCARTNGVMPMRVISEKALKTAVCACLILMKFLSRDRMHLSLQPPCIGSGSFKKTNKKTITY